MLCPIRVLAVSRVMSACSGVAQVERMLAEADLDRQMCMNRIAQLEEELEALQACATPWSEGVNARGRSRTNPRKNRDLGEQEL